MVEKGARRGDGVCSGLGLLLEDARNLGGLAADLTVAALAKLSAVQRGLRVAAAAAKAQ